MPITCEIHFENSPQKIVFPGQTFFVTVRIKLTEGIKVRAVYIHLRGMAHVQYSDRTGRYACDEDVLDITKRLFNGNRHDDFLALTKGAHDFSFTCTLPRDLPSSLQSFYGGITYTASVVLHTHAFRRMKIFGERFIVNRKLDLNDYPSLRSEISKQNEIMSVRIPNGGGYIAGQSISLHLSVRNISYRSPCNVIAYFMRKTVYHFKSAHGEYQKTFLSIVFQQDVPLQRYDRNTRETSPALKLIVPKLLPTQTNEPIKISYFISIKGFKDSREYHIRKASIQLDIPITIGTTPFNDDKSATANQLPIRSNPTAFDHAIEHIIRPSETQPINSSATQIPDDDTVSIRTYTSTPPPFPDDDIELPSYEEAMLMDDGIDISLHSIEDSFAQMHVKSTNN